MGPVLKNPPIAFESGVAMRKKDAELSRYTVAELRFWTRAPVSFNPLVKLVELDPVGDMPTYKELELLSVLPNPETGSVEISSLPRTRLLSIRHSRNVIFTKLFRTQPTSLHLAVDFPCRNVSDPLILTSGRTFQHLTERHRFLVVWCQKRPPSATISSSRRMSAFIRSLGSYRILFICITG